MAAAAADWLAQPRAAPLSGLVPRRGLRWAGPGPGLTLLVPAGCQARSLDLVFALDASASVGPENFAQMQSFVRSCALRFDVNPDVTQVGLVVYGGQVRVAFGLDTHATRAAVLRAVSQAPYLGGVGSAGTALLHIHDRVMTVQRGARPGVPKAVVVLTGGLGAEDAAVPVRKLRNNSVSVLVVGVGPVLREALRRLAGPRDSLLHVATYADLRHHQDALIQWICGGERGSPHPSLLLPGWGWGHSACALGCVIARMAAPPSCPRAFRALASLLNPRSGETLPQAQLTQSDI